MTGLWRDVSEIPESLSGSLASSIGFDEAAELLASGRAGRVVASGNGAAYYVAHALWLASLRGPTRAPEILAVPAGMLAAGQFQWREDDVLLAVSSSGEFRDVVEAASQLDRVPYVALTAKADSTLGRRAAACALYTVRAQRAVTHTQVFCGAILTALALWARISADAGLGTAIEGAPDLVAAAISQAERWLDELVGEGLARPRAAITFGSGQGWTAALEAALLMKEVAAVPAEGAETREGATSSMYPLKEGDLVFSLPVLPQDEQLSEAEAVCAGTGATVVRAPSATACDERLASLVTFPAACGLSAALAVAAGLDPDHPSWTGSYYATARSPLSRPPHGV